MMNINEISVIKNSWHTLSTGLLRPVLIVCQVEERVAERVSHRSCYVCFPSGACINISSLSGRRCFHAVHLWDWQVCAIVRREYTDLSGDAGGKSDMRPSAWPAFPGQNLRSSQSGDRGIKYHGAL